MNDMLTMLSQLQNNPASLLGRFGIPQNLMNDPKAVIQYMMNNGQITQSQYDQAVQMANRFKSMMQ